MSRKHKKGIKMKNSRLDSGKKYKLKTHRKRCLSIVLALALLITLPVASFAMGDTIINNEGDGGIPAEMPTERINNEAEQAAEPEEPGQADTCVCETLCTEDAVNGDCAVCAGSPASCTGKEAEPVPEPEPTPEPKPEPEETENTPVQELTIHFKVAEANDGNGLLKPSALGINGDGTVTLPGYEDVFTAEDYEIPGGLIFKGWSREDLSVLEAGGTAVLSEGDELAAIFEQDPNAQGTALGGMVANANEFVAALGGAANAEADGNTITLKEDVSLEAAITVGAGSYTLNGNGHAVTRGFAGGGSAAAPSAMFLATGAGTGLAFGDIVLDGNKTGYPAMPESYSSVIYAMSGAAVDINSGAVIRNNARNGVVLEGEAAVSMSGGKILDNQTGVSFYQPTAGTVFNMSGGTISGSTNSGIYLPGTAGTANLSGGEISYNTSARSGGGVGLESGAAVHISGSVEIVNNSTTNGNGGGGLYDNSSHITFSGTPVIAGNVVNGTVSGSNGGYTLSGGTENNLAFAQWTAKSNKRAITGELGAGANIGITSPVDSAVQIIRDDTGEKAGTEYIGAQGYFRADSPAYATTLDGGSGNIVLAPAEVRYTLTGSGMEYSGTFVQAIAAVNASASGGTITLLADITLAAGQTVTKNTVILGGGHTIARANANGAMLIVDSGATLTLGNSAGTEALTLDGKKLTATGPVIQLGSGVLNMYEGTILQDNINNANAGAGGVQVGGGGTFNMYGGRIWDCEGMQGTGGVVISGGAYLLSGGVVSGNKGSGFGGGICLTSGRFEMSGGAVSYNKGGFGGGLYIENPAGASVKLTGGEISYNDAAVLNGGIGWSQGLHISIAGTPVVTGNIEGGSLEGSKGSYTLSDGAVSNIMISGSDTTLKITGPMAGGARIDVSGDYGVAYPLLVATNETGTPLGAEYYGADGYIRSDNANYVSKRNADGNIVLGKAVVYVQQPQDTLIPEKGGSISFAMDSPVAGLLNTVSVYTAEGARVSGAAASASGDKGITVTFSSANALAAGEYYVMTDDVKSSVFGLSTWSLSGADGTSDAELTAGETVLSNDNNDAVKLTVNPAKAGAQILMGTPALSLPGYTPQIAAIGEVKNNRNSWGSADAMKKFGFGLGAVDMNSITGDMPIGSENAVRLYNAYALSETVTGGSLKIPVKIMDGASALGSAEIEIPFNVRQATISVSIPIASTAKIDAAGEITFPDAQQLTNASMAPVQLTNVAMSWTADAGSWVSDINALSAQLGIGSNRYVFSNGGSMAYSIPAAAGKVNGGGSLMLDWGMKLGAGNVLNYWNAGESVHMADIVYTVKMAQ